MRIKVFVNGKPRADVDDDKTARRPAEDEDGVPRCRRYQHRATCRSLSCCII